jgi:hypothetical protein
LLYPDTNRYFDAATEKLKHELAHYFRALENRPDPQFTYFDDTHDLIKTYGSKWFEKFLADLNIPEGRPADQTGIIQTIMRIINQLVFGKTEVAIAEIENLIQVINPTNVPPAKISRIEELATIMEAVETRNGDPKTLGMRYNNPGCLMYADWEKQYGAIGKRGQFARFPTYSQGKKAQLHLLRAALSGRMMPSYDPNGSIKKFIYAYASTSPEIEKINYVNRVCEFMKVPSSLIIKTFL